MTKARVIQNEACKYIGMKPDLYDPIEEDVKAELECIAYQITDLTLRMAQDAGLSLSELRADGGPHCKQVPDAVSERHSASDSLCVGCGRAFRLRCSVRSRVFLRII